ncbi:MAG TPA: hypothetical protein VHG08_17780, partial [Longimicrobium sp.]|nr:hypothetical protein [Longimicrobium sp.]
LILAVAAGAAAAVQGGRDPGGEGEAAQDETVEDYLNPALTPEESAAVERGIDAHVERTRRRARAEAGLDEVEPRTAPPTPRRSGSDYQQCMESASHAPTQEDRAIMERGCRNLPGAP